MKHVATFVSIGKASTVLILVASLNLDLGFDIMPGPVAVSAADFLISLQRRPSTPQFSCVCKSSHVPSRHDEYESVDPPIHIAFLVLFNVGLVLCWLLSCDHHLLSQLPPLRKVSRSVLGAHISTVCSSPCVSRRSSSRCDALS